VLIDSYHNLKFPEDGYILRDSIFIDRHPYEWKGDHVFTNYMQLLKALVANGYFVETLNQPITCFDGYNYGAFILSDPEKALSKTEVTKLQKDVELRGLSVIVLAEWSDLSLIQKHTFTSEFSGKVWTPKMGGSNLKSLNTLLQPYGMSLKESSYSGNVFVGDEKIKIESGAIIDRFPNKGYLFSGKVIKDIITISKVDDTDSVEEIHPLVGVYDLSEESNLLQSGSILVIGDSY